MHALAQIMAARPPAEKLPRLGERERLDKRAQIFEQEYLPGEFNVRKPARFCTPEDPCYNIKRGTIWEAMGGPVETCVTCQLVMEEVKDVSRDFPGWLTTREGRFELWCAEQSRKTGLLERQRTTDSKEPPSFG